MNALSRLYSCLFIMDVFVSTMVKEEEAINLGDLNMEG